MLIVPPRVLGMVLIGSTMALISACSREAVSDGGGGLGAPGCTCDDEWSVECYCSVFRCQTYEDATDTSHCASTGSSNAPTVRKGCGLVAVGSSADLGSSSVIYSEESHEVVGASSIGDDSPCTNRNRFSVGETLSDCAFVTTEPLCR